jgi:signal peptidase I
MTTHPSDTPLDPRPESSSQQASPEQASVVQTPLEKPGNDLSAAANAADSEATTPAPDIATNDIATNQDEPAAAAPAPYHTEAGPTGLKFVTSVLVIVVFLITFVVQAFRVPSESMENTLLVGDFLLADKVHFAHGGEFLDRLLPYTPVKHGDIVVFRYPVDPSQYFVKRVVGVPGDRIRLTNKTVLLNGKPLLEDYAVHNLMGFDAYRDDFPQPNRYSRDVDRRWRGNLPRFVNGGELTVPAGQYFVMGDNRDRSLDSRYWGFVPRESIMGRPLVIYLSVAGPPEPEGATSNDKLLHSGQMLAHFFQLARWDRMFRLVR